MSLEDINSTCEVNYKGISGETETEAAVPMWNQTLNSNLCYTMLKSNGDKNTK